MPRLDFSRAHRARPRFVSGFGATCGHARNPRVAKFLFQVADDRAEFVSRARFVYTVDEAEKHAEVDDGRGSDHTPGAGVLRLTEVRGAFSRWEPVDS